MSDGLTFVALWGVDHEELGEMSSVSADPRTGLAITRGLHKKAYRYEDPNEDVVAAVCGPRATLVVCADGHSGALAPTVATEFVLDHFGEDPPAALDDHAWLDLFAAVNEAVIARKGIGSPQPASNTVLIVALVTADTVSWAALGDGALVLARPGSQRGRQLNEEAMRFVGHPMSAREVKKLVGRGTVAREPGEWVVAVTDGLSEFIAPMRPADAVPRVLATADGAEGAARRIVEVACSAGAGDNVAVVAVAP